MTWHKITHTHGVTTKQPLQFSVSNYLKLKCQKVPTNSQCVHSVYSVYVCMSLSNELALLE